MVNTAKLIINVKRSRKPSLKAQEAKEAQEQGSHKGTWSMCYFEHPLVTEAIIDCCRDTQYLYCSNGMRGLCFGNTV